MRLPTIQGLIKRRILVNFRANPDIVQKILPSAFRPKLHEGKAVVGICLIRLENMRPLYTPEFIGFDSENAAHRIAVCWDDENGETREGVYIPRRDTNSFINTAVGGKLFPGEPHRAEFVVRETENGIDFKMVSTDEAVTIELKAQKADSLPASSIFSSVQEASNFFEPGSLGYSVTKDSQMLDGIRLQVKEWKVSALNLISVHSSFYEDTNVFPVGSLEFDHGLIMENIEHEWHNEASFKLSGEG